MLCTNQIKKSRSSAMRGQRLSKAHSWNRQGEALPTHTHMAFQGKAVPPISASGSTKNFSFSIEGSGRTVAAVVAR